MASLMGHLPHYLEHGYAVAEGFLGAARLAAAVEEFLGYFPAADELELRPNRYGGLMEEAEHLQQEFPFAEAAGGVLNDVSTDAALAEFAAAVLGGDLADVRLSQAAIWAKYAGTGSFEQGLHLDYQGNTLVVPVDEGPYRQLNVIIYYTDVSAEMGPTMVVSRTATAGLPVWPTHRTKKKDAALYKLERPVIARAGGVLLFGMGTWHRASEVLAERGARFSHHLVFRSARAGFNGYHLWSRMGENPELMAFVARCSVGQRTLLGFPPPGDAYWTPEALAGVALRYPGMRLDAYR